MADLSITVANVIPQAGANMDTGKAGATVTAGQIVYKAAATGLWGLADCDSATAEVKGSSGVGMALHGSLANQPLTVLLGGPVALGAILTAGAAYYLSETPGGIRATPDTGDYVVPLGFASSTSVLNFAPKVDLGVTL